jgi:SAM-dependent methyltransferase
MKTTIQFEPLVEFGSAVTMEFRSRCVQAYSDVSSGYVFFDPPPAEELNDYYQREYPQSQVGYYTIETDYDAGKNGYQAGRILEAYNSVMQRPPQTSFELGCAYGGLVAEMAGRGVASRGSDINEEAIRQGTELKGNRSIFHANNLDALARMESKVDLIYSLGSLEHDPNMFHVIEACREKLNENGLLFIMVPNAMFASSVLNGFKHNWWVNYPHHLHMPSPGFIPSLCRKLGFIPLFWDTRILFEFEAQTDVFDLFSDRRMTQTHRDLWSLLLLGAGFGMELNFALTPDAPSSAIRFAKTAQEINGTLEHARQQEIKIRRYLKNAAR